MFNNGILELAASMFANDLRHSVGYSFSHNHDYVKDKYSVTLEIHTVIDPTTGMFSPLFTLNQRCDDHQRATVLRMSNKTCFCINGSTAHARQFDPLDENFADQLGEHGFDERGIELVRLIQFSINMYMNKQK